VSGFLGRLLRVDQARSVDSLRDVSEHQTGYVLTAKVWGHALDAEHDGVRVMLEGEPWLRSHRKPSAQLLSARLARDFRIHGRALLDELQGAFVLAIIDLRNGTALFAIDRFGARSLCYSVERNGALYFATSPEDVRRQLGDAVRVNSQALYSFLYFQAIPSPESIYQHVTKLEPAQCLAVSGERRERETYWQPVF
jgi:asparagine synthetase B (glutamine-hydrolysing)